MNCGVSIGNHNEHAISGARLIHLYFVHLWSSFIQTAHNWLLGQVQVTSRLDDCYTPSTEGIPWWRVDTISIGGKYKLCCRSLYLFVLLQDSGHHSTLPRWSFIDYLFGFQDSNSSESHSIRGEQTLVWWRSSHLYGHIHSELFTNALWSPCRLFSFMTVGSSKYQ